MNTMKNEQEILEVLENPDMMAFNYHPIPWSERLLVGRFCQKFHLESLVRQTIF